MAGRTTTRQRLVAAATTLFIRQGFETTTVDEIAAAAGVSRMTFFRHFPTKDDVVFPDHEALLQQVRDRLGADEAGEWQRTIREAAAIVLEHYLAEGQVAKRRYRLTSTVPALRDREVATVALYQRAFGEYLARVAPPEQTPGLWAQALAAATVAAHNVVLRRYLRGESSQPRAELDAALGSVTARFGSEPDMQAISVVAVRANDAADEVTLTIRGLRSRD